jgi:hypothetical protein
MLFWILDIPLIFKELLNVPKGVGFVDVNYFFVLYTDISEWKSFFDYYILKYNIVRFFYVDCRMLLPTISKWGINHFVIISVAQYLIEIL